MSVQAAIDQMKTDLAALTSPSLEAVYHMPDESKQLPTTSKGHKVPFALVSEAVGVEGGVKVITHDGLTEHNWTMDIAIAVYNGTVKDETQERLMGDLTRQWYTKIANLVNADLSLNGTVTRISTPDLTVPYIVGNMRPFKDPNDIYWGIRFRLPVLE